MLSAFVWTESEFAVISFINNMHIYIIKYSNHHLLCKSSY